MKEVFIDIFKGLGAIVLTFFLPKHILLCIREMLWFAVNAIVKYWFVSLGIIVITFGLNNIFEFSKKPYSLELAGLTVVIVFVITFWLALVNKLKREAITLNVGIYGCFSVRDKEYLQIDIDAESINEKLIGLCAKYNSSLSIFRSGHLSLDFIELPKFLPILLGYKGLNKRIESSIEKGYHLFSLHFIREINEQKLSAIFKYNRNAFVNPEFIEKVIRVINILTEKGSLNYINIAELSLKLVTLIFNQSLIDYLIQKKDFQKAHSILSDSEKLMHEIGSELSTIDNADRDAEISNFKSVLKAVVERYKSILLIEQGQYVGAIQYIFKSISLNPYYPYDNYEMFKKFYSKKYAISFSHTLEETESILIEGAETDYTTLRQNLSEQIDSFSATFNTDVVLEIVRRDSSERLIKLIEDELLRLDDLNPALLLLKSEVLKHLPKGEEKFNEIFVDRFDECIEILKKIIEVDKEFPLIHTKLSGLLTSKGMHFADENAIREGMEEFTKGMHLYTELGLKVK